MSQLQQDLAELETLDRAALCARWVATFKISVPRSAQAPMLRRMIAWKLQMNDSSEWRHPAALKRLIRSLGAPTPATLTPGTQLLRQWKDRTHQITVLAQGYEYEGAPYRSLSAIARRITGTPWSGPAFFGLRT